MDRVARGSDEHAGAGSGSARWVVLRGFATLVLVVVAYYTLPDNFEGEAVWVQTLLFGVCVAAFAGLIIFLILREPAEGTVPARAEGLLLTVVVSLAFFATVYYRLAQHAGQFEGLETRTDGLYFTLVTTATIGYGDVHAVGQGARIAVMVHIVFNLVFLGAGVSVATTRLRQRRRTGHGSGG